MVGKIRDLLIEINNRKISALRRGKLFYCLSFVNNDMKMAGLSYVRK